MQVRLELRFARRLPLMYIENSISALFNQPSLDLTIFIPIIFTIFSVTGLGKPKLKNEAELNRNLLLDLLRSGPLTQKQLIIQSNLSKSNLIYAINTLIKRREVKKVKNLGIDMRGVVYHLVK